MSDKQETQFSGPAKRLHIVCGADFKRDQLESWLTDSPFDSHSEIFLDFHDTSWFDVASLAFLLCVLSNLRSEGADISLRLPDFNRHRKTRDFLTRWNLKSALLHSLDSELSNVLESDQLSYFDEDLKYYTPSQMIDNYRELTVLSSLNLLEFTHLTELMEDGNYSVSFRKVGQVTNRACARVLYSALENCIGAPREWAENFGQVLIHQALLNAFEHPDANVAFIVMARQGTNLVLAISDNGQTIPTTIEGSYAEYEQKNRDATKSLSGYNRDVNKIVYATFRGTSRKPLELENPERGMGLYYLKQLSTQVGGRFRIRTSEASVEFHRDPATGGIVSQPERAKKLERGNLLKFYFPLQQTQAR